MEQLITNLDAIVDRSIVYAIGAAVVIVAATAVLAHLVTRLLRRLMRRDDIEMPSASIVINVMRAIVWAFGISLMLSSCFNVDVTAAIAAAGVVGIIISLGLKDTMANLIGGLQVTMMRLVEPGDYIGVGGIEGIVEDVTWRQTVVSDVNNTKHIIPNATINAATVQKYDTAALVVVPFVINNDGNDIDETAAAMERLAKDALARERFLLKQEPWILFNSISDYGINGKVRFVLAAPERKSEARDVVIRAISPLTRQNFADVTPADEEVQAAG